MSSDVETWSGSSRYTLWVWKPSSKRGIWKVFGVMSLFVDYLMSLWVVLAVILLSSINNHTSIDLLVTVVFEAEH